MPRKILLRRSPAPGLLSSENLCCLLPECCAPRLSDISVPPNKSVPYGHSKARVALLSFYSAVILYFNLDAVLGRQSQGHL